MQIYTYFNLTVDSIRLHCLLLQTLRRQILSHMNLGISRYMDLLKETFSFM